MQTKARFKQNRMARKFLKYHNLHWPVNCIRTAFDMWSFFSGAGAVETFTGASPNEYRPTCVICHVFGEFDYSIKKQLIKRFCECLDFRVQAKIIFRKVKAV